ncbi:MAG: NTP transferase domain-containing protein [Gammaproteobacteria bacterium]|nr:NTP transferase domain-containing protein [Gammaproteobacteria bacterium]
MSETLFGLVLAGGDSTRMQRDKALLAYHDQPQLSWAYQLIAPFCEETFISVRNRQHDEVRDSLPRIEDELSDSGPAAGLLAAAASAPEQAWLVVACDLPFLNEKTLDHLVKHRDPESMATAFRSVNNRLPEPLCAIWEPAGLQLLREQVEGGLLCPRKALVRADTRLLDPVSATALDNINTPDEHKDAARIIDSR